MPEPVNLLDRLHALKHAHSQEVRNPSEQESRVRARELALLGGLVETVVQLQVATRAALQLAGAKETP